jgi:hypothetical protein
MNSSISSQVSFSGLPTDTIYHVMQFYELPFYRYVFELKASAEKLLMKLLYGYFEMDDSREIFNVFPCISFPCFVTSLKNEEELNIMVSIVNKIVTVKGMVSLDLTGWVTTETMKTKLLDTPAINNNHFKYIEKLKLTGAVRKPKRAIVDYVKKCSNVISLHFTDIGTNFSIFSQLKELRVPASYDMLLPLNLTDITITGFISDTIMNEVALLPHLVKCSVKTRMTKFNVNPNLTNLDLNVITSAIDSQTLSQIFKLQNLNTLKLTVTAGDISTFPLIAANTSITDLRLMVLDTNEVTLLNLTNNIIANIHIKHLDWIASKEMANSIVTSDIFVRRLESFACKFNNQEDIKLLFENGTALMKVNLRYSGYLSQESVNAIIQSHSLQELTISGEFRQEQLTDLFRCGQFKCLTLNVNTNLYQFINSEYNGIQWSPTLKSLNIYGPIDASLAVTLLKVTTLHTLVLRSDNIYDFDIIPIIKENKNLESLTFHGLMLTQSIDLLFHATRHIPMFNVTVR